MRVIIIAIFLSAACKLQAQFTFFSPKDAFAIEVSLDNTSLKRLPVYRNSISSLIVSGDYILGGTSADKGLSPYLFTASLSRRDMASIVDLEKIIPGQKTVQTGFCLANKNQFFAGTIGNGESADGHLMELQLKNDGGIDVKDLGVPVPHEGIFSLLINRAKTKMYGITFPSGKFFSYDLKTKVTDVFDDVAPAKKDIGKFNEFSLKPENYLCKALIEDSKGLIYGSAPVNKLFYFDPASKKFNEFAELPDVWGRTVMGQVETWAKSNDGKLYGGNAGDGQLFIVDPVTKKVKNLGKPIMMNRLRGLAFGNDGKLYGIAGALPGYAHLFSYDPKQEGFKDLGNPSFTMKSPGIEQGIDWRGFQLGTIASSEDGKYIVMGEDESLSQLLIFPVSKN
ncbi:MAG: hypothetical protein JWM28_1709 [Chitinophagaceae bacterium]|nr:hypothetical protein [Chitinophagaceae bacterium]